MSCCGNRRAAWRSALPAAESALAEPVAPRPQNTVRIGHRGEASTLVRGTRTGFSYLFGPRGSTLDVDGADAEAMLASAQFERR